MDRISLVKARRLRRLVINNNTRCRLCLQTRNIVPLRRIKRGNTTSQVHRYRPRNTTSLPNELRDHLNLLNDNRRKTNVNRGNLSNVNRTSHFTRPIRRQHFWFNFRLNRLHKSYQLKVPRLPYHAKGTIRLHGVRGNISNARFRNNASRQQIVPIAIEATPSAAG